MQSITTVLFDLDGTLLDTAPDLAFTLNTVLEKNHRPPLPYNMIRATASHGAKGLLQLGFDIEDAHPDFVKLRDQFLAVYQNHLCVETKLFPKINKALSFIEENNLRWGIVTNKPGWLTEPLLKQLNLFDRAACVVSGDTIEKRKPHPEPMWHACKLLNCQSEQCVYIGDAERDIEAGKRAGMHTLIAMYGYIARTDTPQNWGADATINNPLEIIDWLKLYDLTRA